MTIELSEDDLRGLSANERAALLAAAEDDEEGAVAEAFGKVATAPAPGPAAAPAGEEAQTDPEDEAAAAAAAAAAASPAPAAASPAPAAATPAAAPPIDPAPEAEPPAAPPPPARHAPTDIADQRKALTAQEDDSMAKLMEGEITPAEHAAVRAEVRAKLDSLLLAEAQDRAADEFARQQMVGQYQVDLAETVKAGKTVGLDYTKGDLQKEFDGAVVMFSNELAARNIFDQPGNLANSRQALKEAHELLMRRHGKAAAQAPAAAPAATPAAAGPRPPVNRSALPTTLAATPAAVDPSIAGNKFAHLENITNPAELERALARLSPSEQEEYLGQ
ncbi:hypothetical protein ABIC63_002122 [Pseudacidovorax sp. 1753]|uniref:hypothetical protein n=1 Tax=Pseudacidovorax sp. 1753 TaxID=3156419 RepID=UPI003395BFC1